MSLFYFKIQRVFGVHRGHLICCILLVQYLNSSTGVEKTGSYAFLCLKSALCFHCLAQMPITINSSHVKAFFQKMWQHFRVILPAWCVLWMCHDGMVRKEYWDIHAAKLDGDITATLQQLWTFEWRSCICAAEDEGQPPFEATREKTYGAGLQLWPKKC